MRLTPIQARDKIRQELNKGHGVYIAGRWFDVRVHQGKLQVSDFHHWHDVEPGSEFRDPHGRTLFKYEPEQVYPRLVVESVGPRTGNMFSPGDVVEIVRESTMYYVISPGLIELKVSKKTLLIGGSTAARGSKFKLPVTQAIKEFVHGKWHVWQGTAHIMLSNEDSKALKEFDTSDQCINWLYQFGCKDAARALNAHIKGAA